MRKLHRQRDRKQHILMVCNTVFFSGIFLGSIRVPSFERETFIEVEVEFIPEEIRYSRDLCTTEKNSRKFHFLFFFVLYENLKCF